MVMVLKSALETFASGEYLSLRNSRIPDRF